MRGNDEVNQMIDHLIAADEQPSEQEMAELRKRLQHKVTRMTRRGRKALYVCLAGTVLMLLGVLAVVMAANRQQDAWLMRLATGTLITGAAVLIAGCLGLLMYRGFGFVWARHDFQEAAISELSLQVERLSEKLDKLSKGT